MKVTIHQPEHFPYMGFFQKMQSCDMFVVLDDVQYTKGNFQNRNKFKNSNGDEEWFSVQLEKSANKKLIKDVYTASGNWRKKNVRKLQQNFGFDFSDIYNNEKLIDINMASIEWGRKKLGINTPYIFSSELNINSTSTKRLVDICKHLNANEYISGLGGKNYLQLELFEDIKVTYHQPEIKNYYSVIYNV